jgi:PKD repeat protein
MTSKQPIRLEGIIFACVIVALTFFAGGVAAQEAPTADFTISPSEPLPDEEVSFDASESSAPNATIESYEWSYEVSDDYSDATATGESFSHTYEQNDNYDVTLEIEANNGETDSTTKTVSVDADDPEAAFSISNSKPLPEEDVTFDASESSAPAGEIESYEWSYEVSDDYDDETYIGESFSHSYAENGQYEITLEVTDNGGGTDSTTKTVDVGGEDPTASFTISPSQPLPDETVQFDASESTAPAGEIESYEWSYEVSDNYDDETYTGDSFSHIYSENGDYDVTLEVEDNGGATDSVTKTVTVGGEDPTASFTISPSQPLPDKTVQFDASESTAPAGEIESYEWSYEVSDNYDDETSTGNSFSHIYSENGDYDVTLEVEDNGGATDSVTKTVTVGGDPPEPVISATPSNPKPQEEIKFNASESTAPTGEIESYGWEYEVSDDYSDQTVTGESFSHTYQENGEYDVTLEIEDNGGATESTTKTIKVGGEDPTADIAVSIEEPQPNEEVSFNASGSTAPVGGIESYEWEYEVSDDYSDQPVTGSSFSHTYDEVGEYDVTLTIEDIGGATDTVTKTIEVGGDGPTADFDISPTTPRPNQEVLFDAADSETPAGEIVSYAWDYESANYGNSATGESFSHTFRNYGTYEVELVVTNSYEQTATVTKTVDVDGPGPTADFDVEPSNPGLDERVTFDPSATKTPDLEIDEYRWYINGEQQYADGELTETFEEAAVYNVELEVENVGGKTDRISKTVPVGDKEDIVDNPDFALQRSSPDSRQITSEPGKTIAFNGQLDSEEVPQATKSLFVDGNIVDQSDVQSSNLRSSYQFEQEGTHTVEMEVKGAAGRSDYVEWQVTTHSFNALPTISEQSSAEAASVDGKNELFTFSVQNPSVNQQDIVAEIVAELPDGVSIYSASGVSSGDSAIQTSSDTVSPGGRNQMRLTIDIEDESLTGETLEIPYRIRYYSVENEDVVYTVDERSLEVDVENPTTTNDSNPGLTISVAVISLLAFVLKARFDS